MLILLNAHIYDVGDPVETLTGLGVDPKRAPHDRAALVKLGQDAAFAGKGLENAHDGIRMTLASLFAVSGEANCCLFLYTPQMRSALDVAMRLAIAPITTLAHLKSTQDAGLLTPAMINHHIWKVVGGAAAA
jgi:hypothetical protein